MNNTSFKPSTKKANSFPSNPPAKKTLLRLAIDPSYTLLEETSQATSFIPYT
jgi:hypothetical protein